MIIRQSLGGVLLVVGGLLVVAGCGTSSDSSTAPTTTSPQTTTASTSEAPAVPTTGGAAETTAPYSSGSQTISLSVNGAVRTALVVVPADLTKPAPLVFAFHGHGGTGKNFDRKMNIEGLWPQAIVAYPNGVVGHKGRTDPDGIKTGWQTAHGETGDEDLAFYDALLDDIEAKAPVDRDRIYLMGHSNGSGFVSLLLNVRGGPVAATANMSGQPGPYLRSDPPRSMFMSMGQNDPLVPYANQRRSVALAEQTIGADPSTAHVDGYLRTETGRGHLELAVYDYPGGHEPPAPVPALIVSFFQRHTLSGG